jgi:hypothetical protein
MVDPTPNKRSPSPHLSLTNSTSDSPPPRSRLMEGVLWAMLVIGLIPFVGVLIVGSWSQLELGVAALVVIAAVSGLVAEYRQRRRDKRRR